ncbi:phage tail sheath family protein [Serratia sp. MF2]|uniref:phage tail sheath family protein n=1 Tax=Serratia sp. MF1(2023) TaxID=3059171 RepID=UPI0027ED3473|nr:phage tail sheath family protein [Serratia sp. MF1(2023)]MDQ7104208.1 phage tail sheath family protein [Serratia sp. MF1(2023)]
MAFFHGVKSSQIPTSLISPTQSDAAIMVAVGCAPIHRLSGQDGSAKVGSLALCYNYSEAVAALGVQQTDDFEQWGLSEAAYSHFVLFTSSPVIFINLFDPEKHKTAVLDEQVTIVAGVAQLEFTDVIQIDSVQFQTEEAEIGVDFSLSSAAGQLLIANDGMLPQSGIITVSYTYANPENVESTDAIGGVDLETGLTTGLQLIDRVFPQFRLVPSIIIAPGFSQYPSVAAIMATKAGSINTVFRGIALADLPIENLTQYSDVPDYKNKNNLVQEDLYLCWPRIVFDDRVMRMATQAAGLIASTDTANDDVPYVSPSNKSLQMTSATVGDGEIWLDLDQANYLNSNGIATAINFVGGWKLWGNRMACYPDVTDVKDTFITNRRMFGWYGNNLILTWWQKIDAATNRRLIQTILNSEQISLNSMTSAGYILGGRIEFNEAENSTTDLMDGKITFHVFLGTAAPAEQIHFQLEYDPDYLSSLFG